MFGIVRTGANLEFIFSYHIGQVLKRSRPALHQIEFMYD